MKPLKRSTPRTKRRLAANRTSAEAESTSVPKAMEADIGELPPVAARTSLVESVSTAPVSESPSVGVLLPASPAPRTATPAERVTILAVASFLAVLVLAAAFFTNNRAGEVDELGLYNPAYMLGRYGSLTYPIHGYFEEPVIVHPPIHTGFMGLLVRLGFTWYYAEGVPVAFFTLLTIWIIVSGAFSPPVKLGLLFGAACFIATGITYVALFGTRPEGHVHAAWIAALLLLESGRLQSWNPRRLMAGAFLLSWASSLHYYATPAITGLGVYLVWPILKQGWKGAKPAIYALVCGAALFVIPYAVIYIAPNWDSIRHAILSVRQQGGSPVRLHLEFYRQWSHWGGMPAWIQVALRPGIPLVLVSSPLLAIFRCTRGLAIAALPLQLAIFVGANQKRSGYLVHEIVLFATALAICGFVLIDRAKLPPRLPAWAKSAAMILLAGALSVNLTLTNPKVGLLAAQAGAMVHEGDLQRAATRQILGPGARVAGRISTWYGGGGDHWHDILYDLTYDKSVDPVQYLSRFDAAVDYIQRSGESPVGTQRTLSHWYRTGLLKLRGFYFSPNVMPIVLLSLNKPAKISGYVAKDGRLYRFDESEGGQQVLLTAACPALPELEYSHFASAYSAALGLLELPPSGTDSAAFLATVLFPGANPEPAGLLKKHCVEIGRVNGEVSEVDKDALIRTLRKEDRPIKFYRTVKEMPERRQ